MSPYLRKVRTASGATAVQIVAKERGVRRIVEHLGSAHDAAELAALMEVGRRKLLGGQQALDLGVDDSWGQGGTREPLRIQAKRSRWLIDAITSAWQALGMEQATDGDRAFAQLVAARLIEPGSVSRAPAVLSQIGWPAVCHRNTLQACLARCVQRDYREAIAAAALAHVTAVGDVSLCLYDVTTLYYRDRQGR